MIWDTINDLFVDENFFIYKITNTKNLKFY